MAADTEDLILTISADVRQMQRALQRLTSETDRSVKVVQGQFDKMGRSIDTDVQKRINNMVGAVKAGEKEWTGALSKQGQSLDELRAKFNPVFGVIQRYKATVSDIRTAHRLGAVSADEMAAAIARERQAALQSISALKQRRTEVEAVGGAIQRSSSQTGNLAAQINDIGVQLAGGQSPFLIAIQQGSQINQVLGQQGARAAVGALGTAFTSLLNPVSLATIAIIGLGGTAVQYLTEMIRGTELTEEQLKQQAELIQRVADRWGDALPALKEYADGVKRVSEEQDRQAATDAVVTANYSEPLRILEEMQVAFAALGKDLQDFSADPVAIARAQRAFSELSERMANNKATADDVRAAQAELAAIFRSTTLPAAGLLADRFTDLAAKTEAANVTSRAAEKQNSATQASIERLAESARLLTSRFGGVGEIGVKAAGDIANAIKSNLVPGMQSAIDKVQELIENYNSLQSQVNQTPLGVIPPVFSGGGQFLNPEQVQTFKAQEAQFAEIGKSQAAAMIRGFESFRSDAYWDVNAFRTGYGSDTATRANGTIEKVTRDTVVSLEDAERDLTRRIAEFQSGIQSAIGADTWRALNEGQKAALTSIAYNYGSLPRSIVKAIESGGGPEIVAQAIARLSANPGRRKEEAQAFLSGSGYSLQNAGVTAPSDAKTPDEKFAENLAAAEGRARVLESEYAALAKTNPLIKDYGFAVEKAKIEQELLNQAQAAGVEITPELSKRIDQIAESTAQYTANTATLREEQQKAARGAEELNRVGRDAMQGLVKDLIAGKDAGEAFAGALDKIADKLLDMAFDNLFPSSGSGGGGGLLGGLFGGGGGKGGLLGGLLIPGFLHGGGVAGRDGYGSGRAVHSSVFRGARRMHSGGIVGLRPDEVPTILQKGERVIPRGGGGGTETIRVELQDDSGRMAKIADQRIMTASGTIVQVSTLQSAKAGRSALQSQLSNQQKRGLV